MVASFQWLKGRAGVLREHRIGHWFGSRSIWACTIEKDGDTAIIHAAPGRPRKRRDLELRLRRAGFRKVRWMRQDGRLWREYRI